MNKLKQIFRDRSRSRNRHSSGEARRSHDVGRNYDVDSSPSSSSAPRRDETTSPDNTPSSPETNRRRGDSSARKPLPPTSRVLNAHDQDHYTQDSSYTNPSAFHDGSSGMPSGDSFANRQVSNVSGPSGQNSGFGAVDSYNSAGAQYYRSPSGVSGGSSHARGPSTSSQTAKLPIAEQFAPSSKDSVTQPISTGNAGRGNFDSSSLNASNPVALGGSHGDGNLDTRSFGVHDSTLSIRNPKLRSDQLAQSLAAQSTILNENPVNSTANNFSRKSLDTSRNATQGSAARRDGNSGGYAASAIDPRVDRIPRYASRQDALAQQDIASEAPSTPKQQHTQRQASPIVAGAYDREAAYSPNLTSGEIPTGTMKSHNRQTSSSMPSTRVDKPLPETPAGPSTSSAQIQSMTGGPSDVSTTRSAQSHSLYQDSSAGHSQAGIIPPQEPSTRSQPLPQMSQSSISQSSLNQSSIRQTQPSMNHAQPSAISQSRTANQPTTKLNFAQSSQPSSSINMLDQEYNVIRQGPQQLYNIPYMIEGASSKPSLEGILDLRNTTDTTVEERWATPIIHEQVFPQQHNIREERITREFHTHDIHHRMAPVIDVRVLPSFHFAADGNGKLNQIDAPRGSVAGQTPHWVIAETVSRHDSMFHPGRPATEAGSSAAPVADPHHATANWPRAFTARTFERGQGDHKEYLNANGVLTTETTWIHPPRMAEAAYHAGQTLPVEFEVPSGREYEVAGVMDVAP